MSSIDKRIVQMEFDNKNFESGVKTTLASLKNLNEKLKMGNSAKGLQDIGAAASKVNGSGLSSLSRGVDAIASRFSNLGIIGTTALMNITNSAVNAGKRILSSFTTDPITTGFQEYELKTNAISVILANTAKYGTTIDDVSKALNELNQYADDTIYNFAQMTENIGRFTAAGVDLDTSVASIKGMSNLAAFFGASPADASRAMYQMSQAIAAGKITLQDWNSMVNANMSGEAFQEALIRTSEVMGTGAKAAIKQYGSFRESLSRGAWLTSDVMTETLKQISGAYKESELRAKGYSATQAKAIVDMAKAANKAATEVRTVTGMMDAMKEAVQSGWAISWEYIIGDKEQATKLLTGIKDGFESVINPIADARNEMLKFWNENGGRDDVIKGLSNIIQGLGKGFGAVKDAFRDVFPAMTGEKLVQLSEGFKNLTEKFKMSDETAGKIKNTFKGLFSIFNLGKNAVLTLFKAFSPLTNVFSGIGKIFLTVTSAIGKFASSLNDAANKSNFFGKISSTISNVLNSIGSAFEGAGKFVNSFFDYLGQLNFDKVFGVIGTGLQSLGNGIAPIFEGIGKALGSVDFGKFILFLNTIMAGDAIKYIKEAMDTMKSTVKQATSFFDAFKNAGKSITEVLNAVRESLEAYTKSIRAGTLLKIAVAVALLAGSLMLLSGLDEVKLGNALSGITVLLIELIGAMVVLEKINMTKGFFKMGALSTGMIGVAVALLVLSAAVKQFSDLNWDELVRGLTGVSISMVLLLASAKLLNTNSKGMLKAATSMVVFAGALRAMAEAVKAFGKMDDDTLAGGIFGLALALTELIVFAKLMNGLKLGVGNSAAILVLAGALTVMAQAVKMFGNIDIDALKQGLLAIGLLLTQLALFTYFGTASGGMISTAVGLTILSGALYILSGAVKSLGAIQWDTLGRGLTAMAGGLAILGVAAALMPKTMGITAVGIALMSGSLLLLSAALQSLGSMSWETLAVSLVALAGALTILGVAMYAMSGSIIGATAMVVMAGALALLTPQLMALSSLSLQQVGIGLLALAGAFTVIGVAGLLLTPVIPSLYGLAGAIVLLSLSCVGIGVGLLAFGTGLTLVAGVITGSGFLILEFLRQLIGLLPTLGTKLAEAITNFVTGIANGIPQIMAALTQIITGILQTLTNSIPQIVEAATKLVVALAESIGKAAPKLITVGVNLILALLQGLTKNISRIVKVGSDLVVKFLNAVANNLGKVIQAGINLAIKFINGVADGIRNNGSELEGAIRNLIDAVIKTGIGIITGAIGQFVKSGIELIAGFIRGIGQKVGEVKSKISGMIDSAKEAASRAGSALVSAGKNLIGGFLSGIQEKARAVREKIASIASGLADAARDALGIHSPSRVFMEIGRYTVEGLAVGLNKYAKAVNKPADKLAQMAINSATKPLAALGKALSSDIDSTPVIRPVLDLSNVESGTNRLNSMLSGRTMEIAGVSGGISKSIGTVQNGISNGDIVSAIKDLKNTIGSSSNTTYQINGITYDDGSNITNAVETLVRAAKMERRI